MFHATYVTLKRRIFWSWWNTCKFVTLENTPTWVEPLPPLTHHCIGSTPFSFFSLPVTVNHENAAYRTKLAKVRWHGNSTIEHGTWKTPPCLDPSLLLVQGAIGPHVYVLLCFMAQPGNGTWQLGDSIYMLMLEMRRKYKHRHKYKKFTQVTQWMLSR